MSIAREGYIYILVLAALTIVAFLLGFPVASVIFFVLTLFVTFFFRDPERFFPAGAGQIVSPADGKVVSIRREGESDVLSIFLSVFNVHINRSPIGGKIIRIEYKPGKFLAAFDERASKENEQNSITMQDETGREVRFIQIAGLIARRIVCWRKEGEQLSAGERIGLIKFGSRVDVIFPPGSRLKVGMGEKVRAGLTVIGEIE